MTNYMYGFVIQRFDISFVDTVSAIFGVKKKLRSLDFQNLFGLLVKSQTESVWYCFIFRAVDRFEHWVWLSWDVTNGELLALFCGDFSIVFKHGVDWIVYFACR